MPLPHRLRKTLLLLGSAVLAGAVLTRRRRDARSSAELGKAAPPRVQSAVVDGIPMRWEQHGDDLAGSTAVVFVHGLPTNPRAWRYVIPLVARENVCCLAWEQVGFGGSLRAGYGRDLSIPAQAGYLSAWLRHLGISRAVFVGHDYGGGVIQQLMIASPELFSGVVLTDSVAFDNWPVAAVRVAKLLGPAVARLPRPVVRGLFRAALKNLGHTNPVVAAESFELFWRPYAEAGPSALANQLQYFDNRDTIRIGRHLRPLACPRMVVWGERDPLGLASAKLLAKRIDAGLTIIPGGYHFTPEDHSGDVADAVLRVTALQ